MVFPQLGGCVRIGVLLAESAVDGPQCHGRRINTSALVRRRLAHLSSFLRDLVTSDPDTRPDSDRLLPVTGGNYSDDTACPGCPRAERPRGYLRYYTTGK